MRGNKEFTGTLCGFDDYVSMDFILSLPELNVLFLDLVLEDAIEQQSKVVSFFSKFVSDRQADGTYTKEKVGSLLLNGNNVCVVC